MFIQSLTGLSSSKNLLNPFSNAIGLGNISTLFDRVARVASENSRRVLKDHTTNNKKITLQVQNNKKYALIYRNLIGSNQTNYASSSLNSHVTSRQST